MFENNKCKVSHCGTILPAGKNFCSVHKPSKHSRFDCKNSEFQVSEDPCENISSARTETLGNKKQKKRFAFSRLRIKKKSNKASEPKKSEVNYCRFYNCYTEVRSRDSLCSAHKRVVDNYSNRRNQKRLETKKLTTFKISLFKALEKRKVGVQKVIHSEFKAFLEILNLIHKAINYEKLIEILFLVFIVGVSGFLFYQVIIFLEYLVSNLTKDHFFAGLGIFLVVCWFIGLFIEEDPSKVNKEQTDNDSPPARYNPTSSNYYRRNYRGYGASEARECNTGLKNLKFNAFNIEKIPEHRAGVYVIKCKSNGRTYVGESTNLKRRLSDHLLSLQANSHESKKKKKRIKLQNDFNEFGAEQFLFGILEYTDNCGTGKRWNIESEYIKRYNAVSNGYNSLSHQSHYAMYVDN